MSHIEFNWPENRKSKRKNSYSDVKCKKNKNKNKEIDRDNDDKLEEKLIVEKNGEGCSESHIYSNNNHVYFYTTVSNGTIISLQKEIRTTIIRMRTKYREAEDTGLTVAYDPIFIHINSPGGGIFACFGFIDFLTQMKKSNSDLKFHSIVEGRVASAGTLMSVVCDKRLITEYGYMLIHQLSAGTWGKYAEIKDDVFNFDTLMARIKDIYKKHCTISEDKIDEILSHDIYWNAEKCLETGLVDEIIKI
jgi:ATP-dependent protease ClpP protease subunit